MCGCGPAGRVLWWALVDCTCMVVVFLVVLCPSALLSCVSQHGVSRLQQIVLRGGGDFIMKVNLDADGCGWEWGIGGDYRR